MPDDAELGGMLALIAAGIGVLQLPVYMVLRARFRASARERKDESLALVKEGRVPPPLMALTITEEYAGAFPLWLAPVQVMVVPIADRHLDYAEQVRSRLADAGIRAEVDARSERMQAKLREAQEQKIPVMVVVGDRDAEANAVSPRLRTGDSSQGVPIDEFVSDLSARIASRELWPAATAE
jgi:glycyl-tRNA synthetase (class II)